MSLRDSTIERLPNATLVTARQEHVLPQRAITEETDDEALDEDLSDDGDQAMSALLTLNTLILG